MNKDLVGTGVALMTPFDSHQNVDYQGLENLVNYCIEECKVDYLVILGTTAESPTLSSDEKKQVTQKIKEVNNHRLPMVLGIGGNNTREVVEQLKTKDLSDFTAILSVCPAYNKPTQEGIYQHFKTIAENTDKDIILYNVPSRTGSNMNPETTIRLAKEFTNVVAIKEASPNYSQSTTLLRDKPKDFMILSGDDEYGLPMTLAGGSGVISVIGQVGEFYPKIIRLALDRKVEESYQLFFENLSLIRAIYKEGNPAGVKALAEIKGVCNGTTRLPLVKASDSLVNELRTLLQ